MDFCILTKEEFVMANPIGLNNYSALFKSMGTAGKNSSTSARNSAADKNPVQQFGGENYSVELSTDGLNALAKYQTEEKDSSTDISSMLVDETKLSSKAQDLLGKLRDKYGDYNFIVADDVKNPADFAANSERTYSVILSSEEIEKMAEDEEYADKVMAQVDKATGALEELAQTDLGEGVNFASLAAEVDAEGNTKLFASIEQMSKDQQERFEKLKEKRAEEAKEAEAKETSETDETDEAEETEPEKETFSVKLANFEADSTESLLEKIFAVDWDSISEQEFAI